MRHVLVGLSACNLLQWWWHMQPQDTHTALRPAPHARPDARVCVCMCSFPNGESGADVYDRITIFEDHMVRDINAGRFASNASLVLVSHGLALRVFLMRWWVAVGGCGCGRSFSWGGGGDVAGRMAGGGCRLAWMHACR